MQAVTTHGQPLHGSHGRQGSVSKAPHTDPATPAEGLLNSILPNPIFGHFNACFYQTGSHEMKAPCFSAWAHQHHAQIENQTGFLTACLNLLCITEGKLKKKTKNPTGPAANTEIYIERTVFKKWYFSQGESAMTTSTKGQFLQRALRACLL